MPPVVFAVFAEVPLPGRCLAPLVPFNDEAWLARLYAAMLRDTLDGLEAVPAARYLVLSDAEGDERRALERHVPVPWELARPADVDASAYVILARADAPAAQIEPLFDVVKEARPVVGASAAGDAWLVGRTAPVLALPSRASADAVHAECTNVVMLPEAIVVDTQPAMEALFEELRRHHERAPRTALLAMTS